MVTLGILPAVIAKTQGEMDDVLGKVFECSDCFHLDVMDGKFVSNESLNFDFQLPKPRSEERGKPRVGKLDAAQHTMHHDFELKNNEKKYEAHLMVQHPLEWIEKYGDKADIITFHFECSDDIGSVIAAIRKKGKKAGLAINPGTGIKAIEKFVPEVDRIVVMSVHPGQYGALFLPEMQEKIKQLRLKFPDLDIESDGGVTDKTIAGLAKAGSNLFVSGSYIQRHPDPKAAVETLKKLASNLSS